jgi:hypothetical protein
MAQSPETQVSPVLRTPLPAREANGQWCKGQSGYQGRGKHETPDYKLCRSLCRQHSAAAAQEMIRLFEHCEDERVRYMAAQWVYEQAWGKARDYDPAEDAPPKIDLLFLSPEERQGIRDTIDRARRRKLAQQQQSEIAAGVGGGDEEGE